MALSSRNPLPISITHPNSPVTEAYRTVRTNIQFSSAINEAQAIVFTSELPGAGKTTTASNVAIVFAQAGHRVLLIDGDMRKPQVHHRFQISNLNGLSNVLIRERKLEDCIMTTQSHNLFLLPSGPIPPNPSEMLSSRTFAKLIEECRKDFDLVIVDAPPVLSVSDALILCQVTDGVVLVVNAKTSKRAHVKKSVTALQQVNAKLLGVVLNQADLSRNGYIGGYYSSDETAK